MKRKIYKLLLRAKQVLFALALTVFLSTAHSQTTYTFNYTGGTQTITLQPGSYSIECWGADGGNATNGTTPTSGGKGGYSAGVYTNNATAVFNVYVGGHGGNASGQSNLGGGGGGMSDIAPASNTTMVIIAAGGGGGSTSGIASESSPGGHGGGLTGQTAPDNTGVSTGTAASGGSQTAGGIAQAGSYGAGTPGGFGYGGGAANTGTAGVMHGAGGAGGAGGNGGWNGGGGGCTIFTGNEHSGGGGAGYYGGGGGRGDGGAGGGGSSYIGGVSSGTTIMFGQTGFVTNPDVTGNGLVRITELCSINIYASGSNSLNPVMCSGQSLTLTTDAASNILWSTGANTNSIVVSPTSNMQYSVTGTSTAACNAGAAINVTVSSGLPVLSVNNPSNNICLGQSATLTASGAITYTWTGGVTNAQSFTPTTTNSYTVTGGNGCGTSTAVTGVTVAPLQVNVTANPTLVCEGYAATLTASSAAPNYTWQPNAMTGSVVMVAPASTTIYSVLASDGICSGTATLSLGTKPTPTVTATGSSTTLCEGDQLNLSAAGAQSYVWSPVNITGANISVTPTASTLYQVAGTNSVGCTAYANWVVVVNAAPAGNASTNKPVVCPGGLAVLSANGGTAYVWTNGPSTQGYSVNPTSASIYSVTITGSNGCAATKTVGVNVYSPTVAITTASSSICDGQTALLNASTANSYTWNGAPGLNFLSVSPTVSTVYMLDATSFSAGISCVASTSILITVNPDPVVTIVATKTVLCKNEPAAVLSGSGAVTYTWSTAATTSTINASNQVSTNYFVNGTDANGCEGSSTSKLIKVDACSGISESGQAKTFEVYPNPNNGTFNIVSDKEMELNIISETGQIVRRIQLSASNNHQVEIGDLAAGIYFVTGGSFNTKLVITK